MQIESTTTALIAIALGVAVLFFGKNLRFFAAAAGFLIGTAFMTALFPTQILAALIVGAVAAIGLVFLLILGKGFVQLIVRIIGAIALAAVTMWLMRTLGLGPSLLSWLLAAVAGVVGFFLMARFFDVGLIILTSLIGASLIVSGVNTFIPLSSSISTIAMIALAIVGFFLQRRR